MGRSKSYKSPSIVSKSRERLIKHMNPIIRKIECRFKLRMIRYEKITVDDSKMVLENNTSCLFKRVWTAIQFAHLHQTRSKILARKVSEKVWENAILEIVLKKNPMTN